MAAKKLVSVAPPPIVIRCVNAAGIETPFVRFGLYDGAFDASSTLLNSDTNEDDNFIGSDSRRFKIRITDPAKTTTKAKAPREIEAAFRSYYDDKKTIQDDGAGQPSITLREKIAGSGVFESSWLLTASDPWELKNVQTTTGQPGAGLRSRGDKEYRLRLASMFGYVGIEYPMKSGTSVHVPMFKRSPEERRNMPLQIFVLQTMYSPGMENYVLTKDLENIRIVYSRLGIWPWTVVDPTQRSRAGVSSKPVGKEELLVVPVPSGTSNAALLTAADCMLLAREYPGLLVDGSSGKPPAGIGLHCETDTIRIFYVPSLASGSNGDTWVDRFFWSDPRRGASVIADAGSKISSGMGSSAAHEIGHTLTNHPIGHFQEPKPVRRYRVQSNLMADGTLAHMGGVGSSQRLWDVDDGAGVNQWPTIRASRYTRS